MRIDNCPIGFARRRRPRSPIELQIDERATRTGHGRTRRRLHGVPGRRQLNLKPAARFPVRGWCLESS